MNEQKNYRLGEYCLTQTKIDDIKHNDFYIQNNDGTSTILSTNSALFGDFLAELVCYKFGFESQIVEF